MANSEMMERDPLTGVYTRASLNGRLQAEMTRAAGAGENVSLLVLDLDYLKSVNDAFGHRRGDAVLIELAARIGAMTRGTDLVFRTGGDEFVLVLPHTGKNEASEIAHRMLAGVRAPQFFGEPPLTVSLSMGVATFPDEAESPDALLHKADLRAYEAKRRGRGQVVSAEGEAGAVKLFADGASGRLVERDQQLETLNRWMDGLMGKGRGTLTVTGPGGSGKSRFLEEVVKAGRLRGYMVLTAGFEGEASSLRESLVEQWPADLGERPTSDTVIEVLAQDIGKVIGKDKFTGVLFVADSLTALDKEDVMLLCHVFDGKGVKQAGFAYSGEWARAGELLPEGTQRETVLIQGLSTQGLHVWVRSLLQWECPATFLDWLYKETGGLPGYVRKGLEYLVEQGVIRQRGNSWVVIGDVSEMTLREQLGLGTGKEKPRHNLPAVHYGFVGRKRETEEIRRLLDEGRLVTITGPGGMGKTHLAVHAASVLLEDFGDDVSFVPLAAIRDAESVAASLAQTLGVAEVGGKSPFEAVKAQLRDKKMLLVLDNFEQVMEAAQLVADLLASCAQVKVLATSREALRVRGERVLDLPPLAVPDSEMVGRGVGAETLAGYPAVAMFVQCAQGSRADFVLTDDNAAAVAGICSRLDGLPLAIELVAARVKLLTPGEILARLKAKGRADQEALKLLTGGPRDMPDRHRTMRSAIGWSYDLLSDEERVIFRRLGVFAGGFTLDGAERVVGGEGVEEGVVFDTLSSLLDKSLLKRVGSSTDGQARFDMLETIREYALERLTSDDEASEVGGRHAEYYRALAEHAEPRLVGPEQKQWLAALVSEYANMQAALQWAREAGEWEMLASVASLLWRLWYLQGPIGEGRAWLGEALAHLEAVSSTVRARVLQGAGVLSRSQGDFVAAERYLLDGLELWRKLLDNAGVSVTLNSLGLMAIERGRYDEAQVYLEESASLDRAMGLKQRLAVSLNNLGGVAFFKNDYRGATRFYAESLKLRREMDDKWGIANSLYNLGEVAQHESDFRQAGALYKESLTLRQELGDKRGVCPCLDGLAAVAAAVGNSERACILLGAADALRNSIGAPRTAVAQTEYARVVSQMHGRMGEGEYFRVTGEGGRMGFVEAVGYALGR